jgi:hypothetical protein
MKSKLDQFDISNAPAKEVARAAFLVIDRLQGFKPHIQAMGASAAFLILCEKLGIEDAQDLFTCTKNMLNDERAGGSQHFTAVRWYVESEIAKALER